MVIRRLNAFVCFSCVLLLPVFAGAQESCAELDMRWGRGLTWIVTYESRVAYFGTGTELVAIAGETSVELGRVDVGGPIRDVVVSEGVAYIAGSKMGLIVVDVSDPSRMVVLAQISGPVIAAGVAVAGDVAMITDPWNDLWVYDVSTPATPEQLAIYGTNGYATNVAAAGTTAVMGLGSGGFVVLDISDPANPVEDARYEMDGYVSRMLLDDTTLYVPDAAFGLLIFDLEDPSSPSLIGSVALSGGPVAVAVSGTVAWVAADSGGFHAVDVSNLTAPTVLASSMLSDGAETAVATNGVSVWFATYQAGLAVVDGSDPTQPSEVLWFDGAGEIRSVAALGEYAVVADWSGFHLRVLDLDAAGGPQQIGAVRVPGYVRHLEIASNRAYVALEWADFVVVDLSDPTNPVQMGAVHLPGSPQHVALAGDYALVAVLDGGLQVVDITHPDAPSVVASVEIPAEATATAVAGSIAYVTAGPAGLVTVDISTPSEPQVLATLDLEAYAQHSAVQGNYVYVAADYSGLYVVDVSNPNNPAIVSNVDPIGEANSVVVDGDLAYVGDARWGLVVVDISVPAGPAVLGTTPTPGHGWFGAFVGDRLVQADDNAGVAVFDVSACDNVPDPPRADFSYTPQNPRVGEVVQFTDLSTGEPTNWIWTFWDDNSTSSGQQTTHVFETAGPHQVALYVDNEHGSSEVTRTVIVEPAEGELPPVSYPFAFSAVIPASAHAAGAQGTAWVTDVVLHNPRDEDVTAWVFLLRSGEDGRSNEPVEIVVGAGQSVLLADVVLSSFGFESATGAILVGAELSLIVSSRTYNNAESGTYGQYIPGVDVNQAFAAGGVADLIQLTEGASFRSNLGVANVSSTTLEVAAEIYSADGQHLSTRFFTVPPWSHEQVNGVFSWADHPNTADGYAVIRSNTIGGHWLAYASVVDNRSGDPVYVVPVESSSEPLWVVASAHVQGANNTNWRSDVEFSALAKSTQSVAVQWLSSTGGEPREVQYDLAGRPCERIEDVVAELFGEDGAGAMRIESDGGDLAVTSRTYNDPGDATYGQYIEAVPESDALIWGYAVRLVQLAHSPGPNRGFRTNLGVVNTTGVTTTIAVNLFEGDGEHLGGFEVELYPWQYQQVNNVFADVTDRELDNAYAVVTTWTGEAAYFAYASVVDNRSGDPVFIPPVREP